MTVAPGLITVDLANAGNPQAAVTPEIRRLAVQELVWTAQAAAQQSSPVRFTVQGRASALFGSIATGRDLHPAGQRPALRGRRADLDHLTRP